MPRPSYKLVLKTPDGDVIGTLVGVAGEGFLSLAASLPINDRGQLLFRTLASNQMITRLVPDSQVELWRGGSMIYNTFFQDIEYDLQESYNEIVQITCLGEKDLLARSIIAFQPEVIDRTSFGDMAAETRAYTLVKYNATTDATVANGRLLDFRDAHLSMETDLGRGEMLPPVTDLSGRNLLDVLKEIATTGAIDFDVIKTGPRAWVFRVYNNFSGVDRRGSGPYPTLVFSKKRRTLMSATLQIQRSAVKTVVIMGGTGEGRARESAVRYGPDYTESFHREFFSADTTAAGPLLQAGGDKILQDMRLKQRLTIIPVQTDAFFFGRDYNVGDLVRGEYRDVVADYKVVGVSLSLDSDGLEQIQAQIEEYHDPVVGV